VSTKEPDDAEAQVRQRLAEFRSEHSDTERSSERPVHRRNANKLERPGVRTKLIILLAKGVHSERQLAAMYECAPSAIHQFLDRHRDEIEAERGQENEAYAGRWIADKRARLSELEDLFNGLGDGEIDGDVARAAKDILRAAAEELGQIPNKTTVVQAQPFEVIIRDDNGQTQPDTKQGEADDDEQGL
jgi:hypothetical protein